MISKYQKFEAVTIHREEIKNAPYNPRKISDSNRKKLRNNLKTKGFLGGIVVNKNTMNLISGHKRLEILDSLERKTDYELTVDMTDMTDKEEKEQNIFFNNQSTQGEFEVDSLKSLLDEVDLFATGFDEVDLVVFDIDLHEFDNETEINQKQKATSEEIAAMKKRKKEHKDKSMRESDTNFFIAVIFQTSEEKIRFMNKYNLGLNEQYIKAEHFLKLLGVK